MDLDNMQTIIKHKVRKRFSPENLILHYPLIKISETEFLLDRAQSLKDINDVESFYLSIIEIYGGSDFKNLVNNFKSYTIYFRFSDGKLTGGVYDLDAGSFITNIKIVDTTSPIDAVKDCRYIYSINDKFYQYLKSLCNWQNNNNIL